MTPSEIMDLIAAVDEHDVDPLLVTAIAMIESSGDPWAVRFEPGFRWISDKLGKPPMCTWKTEHSLQCHSWGLMQIMGATARDMGYQGWLTELLKPDANIRWGIRYLAKLKQRYANEDHVISAYNAGSARMGEDGWLSNQEYVNKVKALLESFRSAGMPP